MLFNIFIFPFLRNFVLCIRLMNGECDNVIWVLGPTIVCKRTLPYLIFYMKRRYELRKFQQVKYERDYYALAVRDLDVSFRWNGEDILNLYSISSFCKEINYLTLSVPLPLLNFYHLSPGWFISYSALYVHYFVN